MRYSIPILGAVAAVALVAIVLFTGWRNSYEGELKKADDEAQQLKADRDKARADLEKARVEAEARKAAHKAEVARLTSFLGEIPEGEHFPRPALESVPELDTQAYRLGFQSIHAYRWRGGTLEGSFHFVTEAGPVKQDLQLTKKVKEMCAGHDKNPYDPRAVSGVVMIGIKRAKYTGAKDRSDWMYDCTVNVDFNFKFPVPEMVVKKDGVTSAWTSFGSGVSLSGVIDGRRPGLSLPSIVGANLGGGMFGQTTVTGVLQGFKDGDMYAPDPERVYPVFELKVSTDRGK